MQIQSSVPGLAFSAISHGAVGTVTPLGSVASTTAGLRRGRVAPGPGRWARRAALVVVAQAGAGQPGGAEGGELQELPAVDGTSVRRGRGVGAAVRAEGLHRDNFTRTPLLQPAGGGDDGSVPPPTIPG